MAEYSEALKLIYSLQKFGIKFGLSKTENLLKRFGNPHIGRKYIHIAGTNGKGSVAAFLSSILKEAGYRVGLYTSPHLVRFTERIRINGKEIERKEAADLIFELSRAFSKKEPPTFFEAVTAMALIYFSRKKTDIDIIEVGMGGRLDATNVIDPVLCIITNIGLDHKQFLGNTLLDIAKEKAGIIKQRKDVITGVSQPKIIRFFENEAKEKDAPIFRIGKDVRYRRKKNKLVDYYGIRRTLRDIELGTNGSFQARNLSIALCAIERLEEKGFKVSEKAIRSGAKKVFWPGRMHVFSESPKIILDGAHNPSAIKTLLRAVREEFGEKRIILVIGIMKDKDIKGMLKKIVPHSDYVIYTRPRYSRAADPEDLKRAFDFGKKGKIIHSLDKAIEEAKSVASSDDIILITGSLFTVGEALSFLDPKNFSPDEIRE